MQFQKISRRKALTGAGASAGALAIANPPPDNVVPFIARCSPHESV